MDRLTANVQEELLLIALASKAALLVEDQGQFRGTVEFQQFKDAAESVRPILARLDEEFPSFIPVPLDGVTWKERDSG